MTTNRATNANRVTTTQTAIVEQAPDRYLLGMMQGALRFHQMHRNQSISEAQVYDLLATTITDATHPSVWNIGNRHQS